MTDIERVVTILTTVANPEIHAHPDDVAGMEDDLRSEFKRRNVTFITSRLVERGRVYAVGLGEPSDTLPYNPLEIHE